jgi:hypothetical protein
MGSSLVGNGDSLAGVLRGRGAIWEGSGEKLGGSLVGKNSEG